MSQLKLVDISWPPVLKVQYHLWNFHLREDATM